MNNTFIFITSGIADYLFFVSVISAILVITAWAIIKAGKIKSPVHYYTIWLFTLIGILVMPIIWLYGPKLPVAVLPLSPSNNSAFEDQINLRSPATQADSFSLNRGYGSGSEFLPLTLQKKMPYAIPLKNLLASVWCLGFVFMLIRLWIGSKRLTRIVNSAETCSENIPLDDFYKDRVKILLTSKIDSPVCCGLLHPVILLPKRMYDNYAEEDMQMALSHELAHVERKDFMVNIFQRFIEAILFFHPLVWYASFQLTHHREQICDNHVIAKGASPGNYAQLLTRMVEQGFRKNGLHAVALFEGRLLLRVRSLYEQGSKVCLKTSGREVIAGVLIILLCTVIGAIRLEAKSSPVNRKEPFENKSSSMDNQGATDQMRSISNNQIDTPFRPQKELQEKNGKRLKGSCSISGKIVSAETGEPLGRATAMLVLIETKDSMAIEAASDGSFEFKDVPRGQYGLHAGKASGFQDACYAPDNSNVQSPFLSLNEGEKRSGIVLRLKPAYSISGKILGESGRPFKDSRLGVLAWVESNRQDGNLNQYEIARQTLVHDDGSYILTGLDNRPVFIMVIDFDPEEKEHSWSHCSYPGAASKDQPQMVFFKKGKYIQNADIRQNQKGEFVLVDNGNNKI